MSPVVGRNRRGGGERVEMRNGRRPRGIYYYRRLRGYVSLLLQFCLLGQYLPVLEGIVQGILLSG